MSTSVDARGLSCPQPVMLVMNQMKALGSGEMVVLVDTDTSKENVSRAAKGKGWEVISIEPEEDGYRLTLKKG